MVRKLLQDEGILDADGEIWLHTFPRVLGYAFAGELLVRTPSRVARWQPSWPRSNTFGAPCLSSRRAARLGLRTGGAQVLSCLAILRDPGESIAAFQRSENSHLALVDLYDETGPLLRTGVAGTLRPEHTATVRQAFFGTPLMTRVIFRIHWQALRLWAKRLPFHRKPPAPKRFVTR